MNHPTFILMALGACGFVSGEMLNHEPFDYPAADLSGSNGGSGWTAAWTDSGNPVVVSTAGLAYSDPVGRVLDVSGGFSSTADGGAATTISLRDFSGPLNDVWISFLYQLPGPNSRFEGVSFYRGTQQVFSVSNPSTTTTPAIFVTNNLVANNGVNTGRGVFGQTHFVVMKLTKGGGLDGADRIEAFIDPALAETPSSPAATLVGTNFDFNRVRIAGQDGSALRVDEIRVGTTWEDVSPHTTPPDMDSDSDGLTDAQEILMGLDPSVANTALIAALRANAAWFALHVPAEITDVSIGGLDILRDTPASLGYRFSLRDRSGNPMESIERSLTKPLGKSFLRLKIETP